MIDVAVLNKIDQAKKLYTDDHSKAVIAEWENTISLYPLRKEWLENDVTKQLNSQIRRRIIQIRVMLSNSRDPEVMANQKAWWAVLDELKYWYSIFSKNPDKDIESIEQEINRELNVV